MVAEASRPETGPAISISIQISMDVKGSPMAKLQFLKDLKEGMEVNDVFSVKYKKPPREYAKGHMFEARLADRTGEMNLKYWGPSDSRVVERLYETFKTGDVICVRGKVSSYKETLEVAVDGQGSILPVDRSGYDIRDFIPECDRDSDQMMSRLYAEYGGYAQ